jgi:hypothetical protein
MDLTKIVWRQDYTADPNEEGLLVCAEDRVVIQPEETAEERRKEKHKKRYNPLLKLYMYHVQDLKGEKGFMFVLYCGEIIHKKSTIKYGNTMATYEMMRQEGLLEVEMMHQKLKEEVALMALDGW